MTPIWIIDGIEFFLADELKVTKPDIPGVVDGVVHYFWYVGKEVGPCYSEAVTTAQRAGVNKAVIWPINETKTNNPNPPR